MGLLEEALDLVRHEVPAREKFVMIDAWEACHIVSMDVLSHTMAQERGGEADGRVPAMSLNREMSRNQCSRLSSVWVHGCRASTRTSVCLPVRGYVP